MQNTSFDSEKAIAAIAYVTSKMPEENRTIYFVLKMFYFADKYHLERYGRQIINDTYAAMKDGPVSSSAYDIVKHVRGDGRYIGAEHAVNVFGVNGRNIWNISDPEMDLLSDSEIECLDDSIQNFGHKSFTWIRDFTHDGAWEAADENGKMNLFDIARLLPNSDELVEHLTNPYPD